jgi:hypothetical protein
MKARGTLPANLPTVGRLFAEPLLPAMLPTLPGVVFEPTRLHLPDDLPYERWLQIVRALLAMNGGVQWWIADCWGVRRAQVRRARQSRQGHWPQLSDLHELRERRQEL